ncbi:LOW QUALITY PROTEIN: P2X purinoceptor 3-like [Nematolebias whitei]|uniref:LOW QUALITY PROTEIN: P2X purinoceptor 3-like n=1 Tax=Nematolebias whitei TaxID=451745 RepID=UPI001899121A|nr:LOW QUALITY PROTEIN: P2X purinoceptor 3-like [Nematolebias whitei]
MWSCVKNFFTYETTKSVVVKSWTIGIINRIVQLIIISYFIGWVFLWEKAYQVRDTAIESSVMTKVKGFGVYNNRVMDVADYVTPTQGGSVFCIITKMITTENQVQGYCPESGKKYNCTHDSHCKRFLQKPADNVVFVLWYQYTYDYWYAYRIHDLVEFSQMYFSHIDQSQGGVIGIKISWMCDLDKSDDQCKPAYSFTRLDAMSQKTSVSPGYNFRFAKYFKMENGTDYRTLVKAFAIRFDVIVNGNAGKFNMIPTLINIVAAFTSVGVGTVLCDIILLNFLKGAEQYKAKKFEEVSDNPLDTQNNGLFHSQLSLRQSAFKSSDSGAFSIERYS